eukprot:PhM_4_TR14220/c0_g1_i1/m.66571/K10594/HERC1; E3 ubiquitin-protein ligase HERC1
MFRLSGRVGTSSAAWTDADDVDDLPALDELPARPMAGHSGGSGSAAFASVSTSLLMGSPQQGSSSGREEGTTTGAVEVLREVWDHPAQCVWLDYDRVALDQLWHGIREGTRHSVGDTRATEEYDARLIALQRMMGAVYVRLRGGQPGSSTQLALRPTGSEKDCRDRDGGDTSQLAAATFGMVLTAMCAVAAKSEESARGVLPVLWRWVLSQTPMSEAPHGPSARAVRRAVYGFLAAAETRFEGVIAEVCVLNVAIGLSRADSVLVDVNLLHGLHGLAAHGNGSEDVAKQMDKVIDWLESSKVSDAVVPPRGFQCDVHRTRIPFTAHLATSSVARLVAATFVGDNLFCVVPSLGLITTKVSAGTALSEPGVTHPSWMMDYLGDFGAARASTGAHGTPALLTLQGRLFTAVCISRSTVATALPGTSVIIALCELCLATHSVRRRIEIHLDDTDFHLTNERLASPWVYRRKVALASVRDDLAALTVYTPLQLRRTAITMVTRVRFSDIQAALDAGHAHLRVVVHGLNTTQLQRHLCSPPSSFERSAPQINNDTAISIGKFTHGGAAGALQQVALSDFTVELWLCPGALTDTRQFYYQGERESGDVVAEFSPTESGATFKITRRGARFAVTATHDICGRVGLLKEWMHFAATYSRLGWTMYINGAAVATSPEPPQQDPYLKLGHPLSLWVLGKGFCGKMCEFRLWKVCRSSDNIERDMRRPLVGDEVGLAVYLPLCEGRGHVLHDLGPFGVHALLEQPVEAQWVHAGLDVQPPSTDRQVPEFVPALSGNAIVGADSFSAFPAGPCHIGLFVFPPETSAHVLPHGLHMFVYDIDSGDLVGSHIVSLGGISNINITAAYDSAHNNLWLPFVAESSTTREISFARCPSLTRIRNPVTPDSSGNAIDGPNDSVWTRLSRRALSSVLHSYWSWERRGFPSAASCDLLPTLLSLFGVSSDRQLDVMILHCAVLCIRHSVRTITLRQRSVATKIASVFVQRHETHMLDAVVGMLVAAFTASVQPAEYFEWVGTYLSAQKALDTYSYLEFTALLRLADLEFVHVLLTSNEHHATITNMTSMIITILRPSHDTTHFPHHVAAAMTAYLIPVTKVLFSMCMKLSDRTTTPQGADDADAKRIRQSTVTFVLGVLNCAEDTVLAVSRKARNTSSREVITQVLEEAETGILGSVLNLAMHGIPLLPATVLVHVLEALRHFIAALEDLVSFLQDTTLVIEASWWLRLRCNVMQSAARLGITLYHTSHTSDNAPSDSADCTAWVSTSLFSLGLSTERTPKQLLVRSILQGKDDVTSSWAQDPANADLTECMRSVLAAYINILASDVEVGSYDAKSRWVVEATKTSLWLRQVRQEERTGTGTTTLRDVRRRARLLCRLEPQSTLERARDSAKGGKAATSKVQNWRNMFQNWKALKKVQALLNVRRANRNGPNDETVQQQMMRFLKSRIDPDDIHAILLRRAQVSEQRCSGLHFLTELICTNTNRDSIADVLRLAATTLRRSHYLADLTGCGGESAGRVQAAVHQLLAHTLNSLSLPSLNPSTKLLYLQFLEIPFQPADYTCLLRFQVPSLLLELSRGHRGGATKSVEGLNTLMSSSSQVKILTDGVTVRCLTGTGAARAVQPWEQVGITRKMLYYEVTVVDLKPGCNVSVGLGPRSYNLQRHPGWDEGSCAYHGDDGMVYHEAASGTQQGMAFGLGHTIGCGLITDSHEVFFTRNGKMTNLRVHMFCSECFPIIGIDRGIVRVNFGQQPFRYSAANPPRPLATPPALSWRIFCSLCLRASSQVFDTLHEAPTPADSKFLNVLNTRRSTQTQSDIGASSALRSPVLVEDITVTMVCELLKCLQQEIRCVMGPAMDGSEKEVLDLISPLCLILQSICEPTVKVSMKLHAQMCELMRELIRLLLLAPNRVKSMCLRALRFLIVHIGANDADVELSHALQTEEVVACGLSYDSFVDLLFQYSRGIVRLHDREFMCEVTSSERSTAYERYASYFGWEAVVTLRYLYFSSNVTKASEYRVVITNLFNRVLSVSSVRNTVGTPTDALTALSVLHGVRDPPRLGSVVQFHPKSPMASAYAGAMRLVTYDVNTGIAEVALEHYEERRVVSINTLMHRNAHESYDIINMYMPEQSRRASVVIQSEVDPILILLKELLLDVRDQMTFVWWTLVTRLFRALNYFLQFPAVRLRVVHLNMLPLILNLCQHVQNTYDPSWAQLTPTAAQSIVHLEEREHQLSSLHWTFPSRLPSLVAVTPPMVRRHSMVSSTHTRDGTAVGVARRSVVDDDAMQAAQDLTLHGFPIELCVVALEHAEYNRAEALRFLIEHQDVGSFVFEHSPLHDDDDDDDEAAAVDYDDEYDDDDDDTDLSSQDDDYPDIDSGGFFSMSGGHRDGDSDAIEPLSPKALSVVETSDSAGLYFCGGRAAFPAMGIDLPSVTLSMWVRLNSLAFAACQVMFAHGAEDNRLSLQVVDGHIQLTYGSTQKQDVLCKAVFEMDALGKPSNIVLVCDKGVWTMFKGGYRAATCLLETDSSCTLFQAAWCVGSLPDGSCPFHGDMYEFAAWSIPLTSDEIVLVSRGEAVAQTHQVLLYRFDEGSGVAVQNSAVAARSTTNGELTGSVEWVQARSQPGNCYAVVLETELSTLHDSEPSSESTGAAHDLDKYELWRAHVNMHGGEIGETIQDTCRTLAVQYACEAAKQLLSAWPTQCPLTAASIGGAVNLCKLIRVTCDDETSETLPLLKSTLSSLIEHQGHVNMINVFVEEFLSLLVDEPKIVLYESRHPPSEAELSTVHEVNNPGYNHYTIWFDPRCSLLQGHHQLTFYSDAALTQVIARYGSAGNSYTSLLHIYAPKFYFDFKGEGGAGFWGYRFFAQYSGERFALGLEFLEQLIVYCNTNPDPSVGHAVRTRRTFNALVQAACRSTGRFRRKACAVIRQLLQFPEHFLESEHPDTSVLNDLRACLERQYRREADTPLHSKFVQAVTEMFVAVKDAEVIWRAGPNEPNLSVDASQLTIDDDTTAEDHQQYLEKRSELRRLYSPEYRVGKERVSIERVGPDVGRIEQNGPDQCIMVWSEYLGCTVTADVALYRGRWYFEVKLLSGGDSNIGFVSTLYNGGTVGVASDSWAFNGKKQISMRGGRNDFFPDPNGTNVSRFGTPSRHQTVRKWKAKDVLGVALDVDAGEIAYFLNGIPLGSFTLAVDDPDVEEDDAAKDADSAWVAAYALSSPTFAMAARTRGQRTVFATPERYRNRAPPKSGTPLGLIPAITLGSDEGIIVNFGSAYFEHEPPPGYYAIDVTNFGMGSLLPFNQLRAFVDVTNSLIHGKVLPPFFHDDVNPFLGNPAREGPPSVGLLADDNVLSTDLGVKNGGIGFSGAHAECRVRGGCWYFEVTLTSQGLMQIGWITAAFRPSPSTGHGVGDDAQSWGIDLYRKLKWHNGVSVPISCARRWNDGDVIGCAIDVDRREMQFSVNGRWLIDNTGSDVLFRNFPIADGFIPAVSLRANNSCTFNFGATPMKHRPTRFQALGVVDTWLERVDLFYSTAKAKDVKRRLALSAILPATETAATGGKTRSVELAIVDLVDTMYTRYGKTIHQLSFDNTQVDCVVHDEMLGTFPELAGHSREELQERFLILKNVNKLFVNVYPAIYFDPASVSSPSSIARSVIAVRGHIFRAVREELVKSIMKATNGRGEHVKITVNRVMAARHRQSPAEDPDGRRSLFGQTHTLLATMNARMFRTNQRFWSVVFAGEGAEDVGGPFREHIAEMCNELMSAALPLFVPTPNNRYNTGTFRECYFPSQRCTSSLHMSYYHFLGQLMGGAMRSNEPLGLYLPSMFWKRIVRQPVTTHDLEAVDRMCLQCVEHVRNIEKEGVTHEAFDAMFATETFTTQLCDETVVDLVEDGKQVPLTFDRRREYCDNMVACRLDEARPQIEAIRAGLATVIPEYLLALLTWEDIEYRVCGKPDFTVEELMNSTTYEGITKDDKRVVFMWRVLESATPTDRRNFLKFVSGRERLPVRLRIMPMHTPDAPPPASFGDTNVNTNSNTGSADRYLPKAATCFFALELPDYSSEDVMREKLLYAITHCGDMDTDFRAVEQDENEAPRVEAQSDGGDLSLHFDEDDATPN